MASIGILIAIIVYLVMMVYVGFYFSKGEGKEDSTDHFYLGGRQLGPFVTAMSAEASDMSSWLLMGLPGVAYLTGISDAGWTAIGLAVGTYLNWLDSWRNGSAAIPSPVMRSRSRISFPNGIMIRRIS